MTDNPKQLTGFISVSTTFSKLLFNISRRLIYPFAPEFARGMNVDLSAITSVIALNLLDISLISGFCALAALCSILMGFHQSQQEYS